MTVRVKDLKDQTGDNSAQGRAILLCECCGGEYSANKGDYFLFPKDHIFTCCEEPMKRVVKRTVYEEV